jgi:hypothetical protein
LRDADQHVHPWGQTKVDLDDVDIHEAETADSVADAGQRPENPPAHDFSAASRERCSPPVAQFEIAAEPSADRRQRPRAGDQ